MKALLISNPVSGSTGPHEEAALRRALAEAPFEYELVYTTPERGAGVLAAEAVAAGREVVLVSGGDGTVSEVAREVVGRPVTLGIIPTGTYNNIARSLGVPAGDLQAACRPIRKGITRRIDVGLVNGTEFFFEAAGAGMDAALFPLGEEIKSGRWSRIFRVIRLMFAYRTRRFVITFDRPLGETLPTTGRFRLRRRSLARRQIRLRALFVVVANGPYYGAGYTVAEGARLSDGKLTLSVYGRFGKWELIRHFRAIAGGKRAYSPRVSTYHAAEIELNARAPIPIHADGRAVGQLPAVFRAEPKALRVFAPA